MAGPEAFGVLARGGGEYRLPYRVARRWLSRREYLRAPSRRGTVPLDHRVEMRSELGTSEQWKDWYLTQLRELGPGVTEVLIHPGYDDAELQRFTQDDPGWGAAWRQRDLDTVLSPEFAAVLSEIGAVRVTWRQLGTLIAS